MRAARTMALVAGVVVSTACAGPRAPYDIANQAAPLALVLGAHAAVVAAPVGPITRALPPGIVRFLPASGPGSPTVTSSLPPVVDLGPCPNFGKLDPVSGGTASVVSAPPQPGTYVYRAKTTDAVGTSKSTFAGNSTWKVTVSAPDPSTGGYHVTLEVTVGSAKSSRVLLILPNSTTQKQTGRDTPLDAPPTVGLNETIDTYNATVAPYGLPQIPRGAPEVARYGPAGIYLVSQTSGSGTFTPTVPIPLVQTPLSNDPFTSIGTDGVTTMTFVSTVKRRANVNACGKKLDGLEVELSDGHIGTMTPDGKAQRIDFTETIDFGLQFGGLLLRDRGTVSGLAVPGGAAPPEPIQRTFDFTINSQPKPPKA